MDYENLNFNFILTGEIWTGRTFKINNPGRDRILKAKKKEEKMPNGLFDCS